MTNNGKNMKIMNSDKRRKMKLINEGKNEFISHDNIGVNSHDPSFKLYSGFFLSIEKEPRFPKTREADNKVRQLESEYLKKLQKINEAYYSYWQALLLEFDGKLDKIFEEDKI